MFHRKCDVCMLFDDVALLSYAQVSGLQNLRPPSAKNVLQDCQVSSMMIEGSGGCPGHLVSMLGGWVALV